MTYGVNHKKLLTGEMAKKRLAMLTAEMKRRSLEESFEWTERQQSAVVALEKSRQEGIGIPRILYGGALGGGKSFFGCKYAVDICERVPRNRWYICRKESSTFMRTTFITMLDAVGILDRPGWHHAISRKYFYHDNGSRIDYGGLGGDNDDVDKVKSMDLGGAFMDEASEIDESSAKMLMARVGRVKAAQNNEAIILASNPEQCWLINAFIQEGSKPGWEYVPALPTDNPHLTAMYIENIRDIYGDTPELYKAYMEGDWFAVGSANKVFDFTEATLAMARDLPRGDPVEFGVDIARYGDDATVLVGKFGERIEILERKTKQDILATAEMILGYARIHRPVAIKVDDVGLGGGVTDILASWGLPVFGVVASGRPIDTDRFFNFKAELTFAFIEKMKRLQLPNDQALREQLLSIRYRIQNGKIVIESKDELRKRLGASPDELDGILLACVDVSPFIQYPVGEVRYQDIDVNISPC